MRALGAIPVDRAHPTAVRAHLAAIQADAEPVSFVVFAEGGIPPLGEQRRFKTGAFVLAIESGAAVVPVSISGSDEVLPRGRRIWINPGTITVQVHPPISTADLTVKHRKELRDRTELVVRSALVAG